ncbi:MAG: iron ABC transporter permease [Deltaproteobacteria bacterium]|nr:iron ABC transporter permease [Deltaproteobacteria bacterium]
MKERINWSAILMFGVAALVIYLTLIPLTMMVYGSFRNGPPGAESSFTLKNYVKAFNHPVLYRSVLNSLIFALGAGSLAFAIGCLLAWFTERTNAPLKGLIYVAVFIEVMIPGILESISWVLLLSPSIGLINVYAKALLGLSEAPFNVYSMGGMIWAFGVSSYTVPFLLMAAAFRSMDPALEEAALVSGSGTFQTVCRITLRLMLPSMLATWLLLFIRGIETFEVPAILGLPAGITLLATEVYLMAREVPTDYNLAATFAMVYVVVALGGLYVYFRATRYAERFAVISGKGFRPVVMNLGVWRFLAGGACLLLLIVIAFLPLLVIVYTSFLPWYAPPSAKMFQMMSLDNYRFLMGYDLVLKAVKNNLIVGIGSATTTVFLTSVIAWIVLRSSVPGRKALDALAFSPIALPGVVFGLSLMWLYLTLPVPVYGTLWILFIAYVSKYMPVSMRACNAALMQVNKELEEASKASGASWWATFRRIVVPLILPGMFVGWAYVLSLTFKVLSLPVLLGHAGTEVVPVLIFDLYEGGQYTVLNALGVGVIVLVTSISVVTRMVSRRFGLEQFE